LPFRRSKAIVVCRCCGQDGWRSAVAAYVRALLKEASRTCPRKDPPLRTVSFGARRFKARLCEGHARGATIE